MQNKEIPGDIWDKSWTPQHSEGVGPNKNFPHLHQTQIYRPHIYTDPDLHKPKITQLRFTQNQIYTARHWHTQIYTTQIYTKLNPNLHTPKFTFTFWT